MQLFSFNIISVKWLFQSDHVFWINSTKFFFKWPYNCGVFTLCSLFLKVPYATNWFHEIFLERNCNFPLLANPYFFRETKLEYTSDILQKKKRKKEKKWWTKYPKTMVSWGNFFSLLQNCSNYFLRSLHSVAITEICSHSFLAKLSWK